MGREGAAGGPCQDPDDDGMGEEAAQDDDRRGLATFGQDRREVIVTGRWTAMSRKSGTAPSSP
jgi:hypothetical protein